MMAKASGGGGREGSSRRVAPGPGAHIVQPDAAKMLALYTELYRDYGDTLEGDPAYDFANQAIRENAGTRELVVVRDNKGKLSALANFEEYTTATGVTEMFVNYLAGLQPGYGIQALRKVGLETLRRGKQQMRLHSVRAAEPFYKRVGFKTAYEGGLSMKAPAIRARWGGG